MNKKLLFRLGLLFGFVLLISAAVIILHLIYGPWNT